MSTDTEPNVKHAAVPMPVPRDPGEYMASTHLGMRLRERVPEHLRSRVIRECIEEGVCRGTTPPRDLDDEFDIFQSFAFEKAIGHVEWRVIVGVRPRAFVDDDVKHVALTVYAKDILPLAEGA